ncbi:MAG: DUF1499 domain-containing protein [Sneathiella sp.]
MLRNLLKNVKRPAIDFESLKKPRKPNSYLMAPDGLCAFSPGEVSPVFTVSKETLMEAFDQLASAMPNTEKVSVEQADGTYQADYVQYSKGMGFPDTLTVRVMDAQSDKSTLAIFSRAHYGYRDFGVNKRRVQGLVKALGLSLSA